MSGSSKLLSLAPVAREVAAEWGLGLGARFDKASYSYVVTAGEDTVLKVVPPDDDEADQEADALALWNGAGAMRLVRHDRRRRVLLLERARPGSDISELPEDTAAAIAIDVATRLWQPAGEPFRWIGDHVPCWLDNAQRAGEPGHELVPLARTLYRSLDVGRSVLVHGDLHHHNILDTGHDYRAIDPKPMLGEREYDIPSFLWNPTSSTLEADPTERRLAAFAAAGLDQHRMRAWAVIRGAYLGTDPDEAALLRALL